MKVAILAGGKGTRISEESHLKPKPMVEIGDMPILWHIMKIYSFYGFNEFIICCGYKGYVIKEFFADYFLHMSDVTFDFNDDNKLIVHNNRVEPWRVTLVDTGKEAMTGARINRIRSYLGEDENFMLTYGDGVSDVNIQELLTYHYESGKLATMTAIQPTGKFGALKILDDGAVTDFMEKPKGGDGGWINAGFMVLNRGVFDYLNDDEQLVSEETPLSQLAEDGMLGAYRHHGFWHAMDTVRDRDTLNMMWKTGKAPWKLW